MIIADDEYCADCGENADVELGGELLCQSCARQYMDDEDEWEDMA